MKYIHLVKLQEFAADFNISSLEEAVDGILAMLDEEVEAINETRLDIAESCGCGRGMVTLLSSPSMEDVEWYLEHYVSKAEAAKRLKLYNTDVTGELPF